MEAREFARFMRFWIHKKQLRKSEIAEEAGMSRSHFSKILCDGNRIDGVGIQKCHKIMTAIGATWKDYHDYLEKWVL